MATGACCAVRFQCKYLRHFELLFHAIRTRFRGPAACSEVRLRIGSDSGAEKALAANLGASVAKAVCRQSQADVKPSHERAV